MEFNKKELTSFVENFSLDVPIDKDFGLRVLSHEDLKDKLKPFIKKCGFEGNKEFNLKVFTEAYNYLVNEDWSDAKLEGESGYLISS